MTWTGRMAASISDRRCSKEPRTATALPVFSSLLSSEARSALTRCANASIISGGSSAPVLLPDDDDPSINPLMFRPATPSPPRERYGRRTQAGGNAGRGRRGFGAVREGEGFACSGRGGGCRGMVGRHFSKVLEGWNGEERRCLLRRFCAADPVSLRRKRILVPRPRVGPTVGHGGGGYVGL